MLRELQREFASELGARIATLQEAIDRNDLDEARTLAHRLYGTAGSYGMTSVSTFAGELEQAVLCASDQIPARLYALQVAATEAIANALDQGPTS